MKRYIIPIGGILILAAIFIAIYTSSPHNLNNSNQDNSKGDSTLLPTPTSDGTKPIATTGPSTVTFKDGKYTGTPDTNKYGTVQVEVIVSGSKITDINFLSLPSGEGKINQISSSSSIKLKSEAISAQSAKVDIVSGATDTSISFMRSMSSALSKAL